MNAERQRENAREYKESVKLFQTHLNDAVIFVFLSFTINFILDDRI